MCFSNGIVVRFFSRKLALSISAFINAISEQTSKKEKVFMFSGHPAWLLCFAPPCRLATTTSTCPILGPTRGLWTVQPRHLSPPPPLPRWWIWTLQKSTLRAPSTPSWPAAPAPTTLTRSSVTTIKRLLVHRYEETTHNIALKIIIALPWIWSTDTCRLCLKSIFAFITLYTRLFLDTSPQTWSNKTLSFSRFVPWWIYSIIPWSFEYCFEFSEKTFWKRVFF